jgi:4-diphosphocytidyl-2-C-methyl-D-erythritol kinase
VTAQRTTVQLTAPAKINLYLRVLCRREDGYHELDSLFIPLALADRVEVTFTPGPLRPSDQPNPAAGVTCACPGHPELEGEHNLAAQAAQAYLEAAELKGAQVELTVHKSIWIAAGLGGGSSDAAAVLLALNRLAPALPQRRFQTLARDLGADVPFFLAPRPALARGIGEDFADLPFLLPELHLVLVNPGLPLKTATVFEGLQLEPGGPRQPLSNPPAATDLKTLSSLIHNDLEPVATRLRPEIAQMQQALDAAGAAGVGMSGSGPTVFGLFPTPQLASAAAHKVADTTGFLAVATRVLAA